MTFPSEIASFGQFFAQKLDCFFHCRNRSSHQCTESHDRCIDLRGFFCNYFRGYVFSKVVDLKTVVFKKQLYNVFAYIVNITFYGGKNKYAAAFFCL